MIGPDLIDVKDALRVTHDSDDEMLLRLIDSATLEYMRFRRRLGDDDEVVINQQSSDSDPFPEDVINGIILLVQQDYDGDPAARGQIRAVAEQLWIPHRESFVV